MRVRAGTGDPKVRVAQEHARDADGQHAHAHDQHDRACPDEVRDRPDDDDRQEARHRHQHVEDAEDAATDLLGQVLLELGLRGDGDGAVGHARDERDDHDDGQQRGDRREVEQVVRPVGPLQEPADRSRHRQQGERDPERDEPALDDAPAGQELAVRVEQQDAHHDAATQRQHDDGEVLLGQPQGRLREVRPQDAEHADERCGDPEIDQRPGDRAVPADEVEPLAQLRHGRRECLARLANGMRPGVGDGLWRRRRCRQRETEAGGQEVQRGDDQDHGLRARDVDDQRAEHREPDRERRVERQGEDAIGRQQQTTRHDLRDHRRLRRREEDGHRRHEDVQQQDGEEVIADEEEPDHREAAQDVRGDQHEPPVDPVDVDAGDGREQDGRHQERQDQQADGGVRLGRRHDDRQAEQHHVAADLRRSLG